MKNIKLPSARIQQATTILILLLSLISGRASATTWDEPWADKVIAGSSSFILAKVDSSDPAKGIYIEVTKTLAGETLKGRLVINGFYLLTICSTSSGEGPEFHVSAVDSCYFFLYKDQKGRYCIATPTAGFDYAFEGKVGATYRHTYHKAAVPPDVYEKTMTAIFSNYHHLPYDQAYIQGFVKEQLSQKPAPLNPEGASLFFLQHVALECVHHLRLPIDEDLIYPFLNDTKNFHSQVSAAGALIAFNTPRSKAALVSVIGDTTRRDFVKVMCVWTLAEFHPADLKSTLQTMERTASTEGDGFGGNIMDPRVCTSIPTVKDALDDLIAKL
jgi:hypothetical protein